MSITECITSKLGSKQLSKGVNINMPAAEINAFKTSEQLLNITITSVHMTQLTCQTVQTEITSIVRSC